LLVRTPAQLDAAIAVRPASITLDYLDLYGLKPSVAKVQESGVEARVAAPRFFKPGEERVLEFLLRLNVPVLVRSAGLMQRLRAHNGVRITGDFSLNAANAITADLLLAQGLERITPTYDLNGEQVRTLAEEVGGDRIEAIVYSHLPVFHTEHCVFCRFLSAGTTYRDCGRPCESHTVALRDASGRAHPVIADVGCRNTVFGAEAQEASAHLVAWREAGITDFRIEFVHESGHEVTVVHDAFCRYLEGSITTKQLATELRRAIPAGTTQGSLFVAADYQLLPVLG
jgi:putative protease